MNWGVTAVQFTDTINLGAVVIGIVIAAATITNIVAGGRKWKEIAEAEKIERVRAEAERDQTREQFTQIHEQNLRLNDVIQTLGGQKVYEAVQTADAQAADRTTAAMAQISVLFEAHERRAEERHKQNLQLFDTVGHALGEISTQINGRSHDVEAHRKEQT